MFSRAAGRQMGAMARTPIALQHYYQFQTVLKPSPDNIQQLYLDSLKPPLASIQPITISALLRTTGKAQRLAPGGLAGRFGAMAWKYRSLPISSRSAALTASLCTGELTYGLERLACYIQGVDRITDLNYNGGEGDNKVTYGDIFLQNEQEFSRYNFEIADTDRLLQHFKDAEAECQLILERGEKRTSMSACFRPMTNASRRLTFLICWMRAASSRSPSAKAIFLRVRDLTKACCTAWLEYRRRARLMSEFLLELFSEEIPCNLARLGRART